MGVLRNQSDPRSIHKLWNKTWCSYTQRGPLQQRQKIAPRTNYEENAEVKPESEEFIVFLMHV